MSIIRYYDCFGRSFLYTIRQYVFYHNLIIMVIRGVTGKGGLKYVYFKMYFYVPSNT